MLYDVVMHVADMIIGCSGGSPTYATGSKSGAGVVYVVYGKQTKPVSISLAELSASDGYAFGGKIGGDAAGTSLAVVDYDNDGVPDYMIGAPQTELLADTTLNNGGALIVKNGKVSGRCRALFVRMSVASSS